MAVTAAQVQALREKTGAGMMDCKRCLEQTGGNEEEAVRLLHVERHQVQQIDLVAEACQPRCVRARTAPDVRDPRGGLREVAREDLAAARALEPTRPRVQPLLLDAGGVVR